MRERVLLKSPLRENRTAGSVRGTSGNWRSYRDKWVIRHFYTQIDSVDVCPIILNILNCQLRIVNCELTIGT